MASVVHVAYFLQDNLAANHKTNVLTVIRILPALNKALLPSLWMRYAQVSLHALLSIWERATKVFFLVDHGGCAAGEILLQAFQGFFCNALQQIEPLEKVRHFVFVCTNACVKAEEKQILEVIETGYIKFIEVAKQRLQAEQSGSWGAFDSGSVKSKGCFISLSVACHLPCSGWSLIPCLGFLVVIAKVVSTLVSFNTSVSLATHEKGCELVQTCLECKDEAVHKPLQDSELS